MPPAEWMPVVLAAGLSRRMGRTKLVLAHGGRTVLDRTVDAIRAASGRDPLVVVPPSGPVLEEALRLGLVAALNPDPARGLSSTLRVAAAAAGRRALLVFLGDQPDLSADATRAVLAAAADKPQAWLVAPRFLGGVPGHPVWIGRPLLAGVHRLEGDRGARALAREAPAERVVEVSVPEEAPRDLDTGDDWDAFLIRRLGAEASGRERGG